METFTSALFSQKLSRIALGTWAIGGDLWGGADEEESIQTIHTAIEQGINIIDTAPGYGSGTSETYVGRALNQNKKRDQVLISTKVGLQFQRDGSVVRNLTQDFILEDLHRSLKRLQTDYVDLYFIHWPDPLVPIEETAKTMARLYNEGKIRAIGVSNFNQEQCTLFRQAAPCHFCQPPYNIFERNAEKQGLLDYCKKEKILLMTYGVLCRGLLSGKMEKTRVFKDSDLRKSLDPKFSSPVFEEYLEAAQEISALAQKNYGKTLLEFSVRWVLDKGPDIAIWGARRPAQLAPLQNLFNWKISIQTMQEVDTILKRTIKHPQDPAAFMGPPLRKKAA